MEKMLTPANVAEILGYKDLDSARRIMRGMIHMENPLRVTETALEGWINERMYRPAGEAQAQAPAGGRFPRRRNGKLREVGA